MAVLLITILIHFILALSLGRVAGTVAQGKFKFLTVFSNL